MFNEPASSNGQPPAHQPKSILNPTTLVIAAVVVFLLLLWLSLSGRAPMLSLTSRHVLIALGLLSVLIAVGASISYRQRVDPADLDGVISATVLMNIVIFVSLGLVVVSVCTATWACSWTAGIIWSLAMLVSGGAVGFLFGIPRNRTGKSGVPPAQPRRTDPSAGKQPAAPAPKPADEPQPALALGAADPALSGAGQPAPDLNLAAQPPGANPPDPAIGQQGAPPPVNDGQTPSGKQDDASPSTTQVGSETAIEQISDWLTKIIVGVGLTNLKEMPGQLNRLALYVGRSIDQSHPNQFLALGILIYFYVLGVITGYLITQLFLHKLVNRP